MKLWKVLARNSHVYNNGVGQEIPVVKAHKVPTIELHGKYYSSRKMSLNNVIFHFFTYSEKSNISN